MASTNSIGIFQASLSAQTLSSVQRLGISVVYIWWLVLVENN